MNNKRMKGDINNITGEKINRYSIRKVSFGAASVAVTALFMFLGGTSAQAADNNNTNVAKEKITVEKSQENKKEQEKEIKNKEKAKENKKEQNIQNIEEKSQENLKKAVESNENKAKKRTKRSLDAEDRASTDLDEAANKVFEAPKDDASVEELISKLKNLANSVENNSKIQNMDKLGNEKQVNPGEVKDITEFGGWKAISADGKAGKFAIARKTDKGVFPIETINTVWNSKRNEYTTWIIEQAFERNGDYMLFLSEVRTQKTQNEETFDGQAYKKSGEPGYMAKGLKGFNGIEKTFKAYSKENGSRVKISFKTGYSGDIEGFKAKYKVEVLVEKDGKLETIYTAKFSPVENKKNAEMTVTAAKDGSNNPKSITVTASEAGDRDKMNEKLAANKPNGTAGTFTSRDIDLPEGITQYTVRISAENNQLLGMGYQALNKHYALPISGLDFSISQDTSKVAKNLLQKIYDKLIASEKKDTRGKTEESIEKYKQELEKIKNILNEPNLKLTDEYKKSLNSILEKQKELKVDKKALIALKDELSGLVTTISTKGKTPSTVAEYDRAKAEAEKAIEEAKALIDKENATVEEVELAVAKVKEKPY